MPGTKRSPVLRPPPFEGVRSFSPDGVLGDFSPDGVLGEAGCGAVPVGLRAMSRSEPQAGQAGSDPATGVAHVGHAYMGRSRLT